MRIVGHIVHSRSSVHFHEMHVCSGVFIGQDSVSYCFTDLECFSEPGSDAVHAVREAEALGTGLPQLLC